jgi:hypothetical protein
VGRPIDHIVAIACATALSAGSPWLSGRAAAVFQGWSSSRALTAHDGEVPRGSTDARVESRMGSFGGGAGRSHDAACYAPARVELVDALRPIGPLTSSAHSIALPISWTSVHDRAPPADL